MSDDLTDLRLEREIAQAQQHFDACIGTPYLLPAWQRLCELVMQRSDAQVERMEREKGLL